MKPGVDWAAIETRFRAGESANVIAKDYPISRQRIEARAKKRMSEGGKVGKVSTPSGKTRDKLGRPSENP